MSQQVILQLQRIIASTEKFNFYLPTPSSVPSSTPDAAAFVRIPPLRLAKLTSAFQLQLRQSGLLSHICGVVMSSATQLAAIYQDSYERACSALLTQPRNQLGPSISELLQQICSALESLYERQDLPRLLSEALSARSAHSIRAEACPSPPAKERRVFNHEYTPLLECYFEYNAYPSAQDRLVLARKSMMTPRQIEVWFQNHRNRAKKEGKVLKRLPSGTPIALPLHALDKKKSYLITPELDRPGLPDQDSSDEDSGGESLKSTQNSAAARSFHNSCPPHAFPTRYPPNCAYDPFPNDNGTFKFAPPSWRRHPAKSRPQTPTVNMDELIVTFASKLSLLEPSSDIPKRKAHNAEVSHTPWFSATVTVLPTAPHPALVQLPYLRSSVISSNAWTSRSATPACSNVLKPRKMARLPRRTPNVSPSCQSPKSRTSSFGSTASSRSRSTSTSSLSSINLHTPLSSPLIQNTTLTEEELKTFSEFIDTRIQSSNLSPLHLGVSTSVMATQIPFSRYQTHSLLSSYVETQS